MLQEDTRHDVSMTQRLVRLFAGLVLFGASLALMVEAQLGLGPWDVLHQGLADQTGIRIGWVTIIVSLFVLVLWIPLRQRPGFGTVANAICVGLAMDATLALLAVPEEMWLRITFLILGVVANGAATGLYIGAGLGPGPRDGLMTGLAQHGFSIRRGRTLIEVAALGIGFVLGGTVGVGTVLYAFGIGPLAQRFMSMFDLAADDPTAADGTRRRGKRSDRELLGPELSPACEEA